MTMASYVNESQFEVDGDHIDDLPSGLRVLLTQGDDGDIITDILSSIYDAEEDVTMVTVDTSDLTANLAELFVGHTFVDSVNERSNQARHFHTASWDGGEAAFGGFTDSDIVDNLNIAGSVSALIVNYLIGVNDDGTALEKKELLGTDDQVTITHAAGLITLSVPQDIATTSTPEFTNLILSDVSGVVVSDAETGMSGVVQAENLSLLWANADGTIEFTPHNIANVSDVELTDISHDQVLSWSTVSEKWVNKTPSSGGGGGGSSVVSYLFAQAEV